MTTHSGFVHFYTRGLEYKLTVTERMWPAALSNKENFRGGFSPFQLGLF